MGIFIKLWLKYVSIYTKITKILAQNPHQTEEPALLMEWCHCPWRMRRQCWALEGELVSQLEVLLEITVLSLAISV